MNKLLIIVATAFALFSTGCATKPAVEPKPVEEWFGLSEASASPQTKKIILVSCYLKQAHIHADFIPLLEKDFGEKPLAQTRLFDKEFEKRLSALGYKVSTYNNNKCEMIPNTEAIPIYVVHKITGALFREGIIYIEVFLRKYGDDQKVRGSRQLITGFTGIGPEKAAEALALSLIKPQD